MNYFIPNPGVIKKNLNLDNEGLQKKVKPLLDFTFFDPQWYFDKYKDVQKNIACKDDIIRSHFIKTGYWEGRLPFFFVLDKVFLKKYYSSKIIISKTKRMDCYKLGALTNKMKFDLKFYNKQFSHTGNHFENEDQAFIHFLKIGYPKLKLPYDVYTKR